MVTLLEFGMKTFNLIILLLGLALPITASEKLRIYTEDWPPLNYLDKGVLKGPAVDIVKKIQQLTGSKSTIRVLPFKRAYNKVMNEKNSMLFTVTHLKKREPFFEWVGPLAEKKYILYSRKDSKIKITTPKDVTPLNIGVQNGGASETLAREKGFTKLHPVTKPVQNLQKLLSGHIDLWCATDSTMKEICKQNQTPPSSLKETFILDRRYLYIVFNKHTDRSIIDAWQKTLDTLSQNGFVEEVFKKHNQAPLCPERISTPRQ